MTRMPDTVSTIKNRILQLCGQRNLTIKKICDGLEITLTEFFNTPEFEALEQEIK